MGRIFLVQLSDIHIGSHHLGSKSWHRSLYGHNYTLLKELKDSLANVSGDLGVTDDDVLKFLISGDLTRVGGDYDFQLVLTYLFSELRWLSDLANSRSMTHTEVGTNLAMADIYAIPGNHDHWDGHEMRLGNIRPPAYNANLFPTYLDDTPWHNTIASNDGDWKLELFGVDSNEGLRNKATNFRAAGELSTQELHGNPPKNGLEQLLAAAHATFTRDGLPRVAAVACHHAFTNRGGFLDARPLDSQSRANLLKIARSLNCRVRAILTGHTHYFLNKEWTGTSPSVWELRCGTGLQLASQMPSPMPSYAKLLAPGYLVHELSRGNQGGWDGPEWKTWKYQWDGSQFALNPSASIIH